MIGTDGKTAYQRLRGKPYTHRLCEFGENILALRPKHEGHAMQPKKHKLDSKWFHAIFLGVRSVDGMFILGTHMGIMFARTIRRIPSEDRWNLARFNSMCGTPWQLKPMSDPIPPDAPSVVAGPANKPGTPVGDRLRQPIAHGGDSAIRSFRIYRADVDPSYGGCGFSHKCH